MKGSRFSEEQVIAILREQEAGAKTADIRRAHGISSATFYAWKAKFGGMQGEPLCANGSSTTASDAKRLEVLEAKNAKLKRLYADAMLDNAGPKDLLGQKW